MYLSAERSIKRKRSDRLFGIHSLGDPGCPADYDGPFRTNIRAFLRDHAEFETYNVQGMPNWSIELENEKISAQITLAIIEESLENSPHPHCKHCRCMGWNHHPVSKRKYHFIIPSSELENIPFGLVGVTGAKVCPKCSDSIPPPIFNCMSCGEEAIQTSIFDLQSHILHGVLHCNGYGHLLSLNGREKGSKHASGRDLMDLWDRLCAMLRARKVSLEDTAKKRSLELRLIHSVAYGQCWFGRWGYKYGRGSFGISQQMYLKAVEAIRGMPLSVMVHHFDGVDKDVVAIVSMYQRISGHVLQTLGDMLRFMMELKARIPWYCSTKYISKDTKQEKGIAEMHFISSDTPCRWSAKRLDLATKVILEALKNCETKWMARQDVRDAARNYIGDTGLLDFVLKSLGNRVVGGQLVRRALNPITKVLEYCLEDVCSCDVTSNVIQNSKRISESVCELSRQDILRDIAYIYGQVLENYMSVRRNLKNVLAAIPTASRIILDTRHFVKDYRGELTRKRASSDWDMDDDEMLRVMCTVVLNGHDSHRPQRPNPPAELVVLPPHATVGDLKRAAQEAFQDTYSIMSSLIVDSVVELKSDNEDLLFGAIESESSVTLEVSCVNTSSKLRYEGGNDNWIVECVCGTNDDDGERMIACDLCEVWQHTRCHGMSDLDAIPVQFLCQRCGEAYSNFQIVI
ncbi:hypothetical protein O6H91_07G032400 [Diphasiastrum complanatum]|uniref:Uncharacterized protein n=2 Tax=Diphasiastrum complanatum TaxID=34168 RepID=A0ACC2D3U6_DIPCM|nr:hypothetical protein O6H91_07G032400 [Diphasiastrum complanatum]KAJ7548908.1 hypothetical protein O6H91_07G032400 [Diphasiastrum complanatum]